MDYEIQIFEHDVFKKTRGLLIDGEPWLVAADVCRNLKIKNTTDSLKRLDEDEKARLNLGLRGGDTNVVNEPGLYRLIFASRKPEARDFQRWVYHEVLPSIRKTGSYSLDSKSTQVDDMRATLSEIRSMFLQILEAVNFSSKSVQADDTQATLSEIRSMFLKLLEAVNSAPDSEKILNELAKAFKQFAQTEQRNGDFERGKALAKMIFALKASPKKEPIADIATNFIVGEKVF